MQKNHKGLVSRLFRGLWPNKGEFFQIGLLDLTLFLELSFTKVM